MKLKDFEWFDGYNGYYDSTGFYKLYCKYNKKLILSIQKDKYNSYFVEVYNIYPELNKLILNIRHSSLDKAKKYVNEKLSLYCKLMAFL